MHRARGQVHGGDAPHGAIPLLARARAPMRVAAAPVAGLGGESYVKKNKNCLH
jgi:hypothetical protein